MALSDTSSDQKPDLTRSVVVFVAAGPLGSGPPGHVRRGPLADVFAQQGKAGPEECLPDLGVGGGEPLANEGLDPGARQLRPDLFEHLCGCAAPDLRVG